MFKWRNWCDIFGKKILAIATVASLFFCMPQAASAMHIMEGYLPPVFGIEWAAVCLPFLAMGKSSFDI